MKIIRICSRRVFRSASARVDHPLKGSVIFIICNCAFRIRANAFPVSQLFSRLGNLLQTRRYFVEQAGTCGCTPRRYSILSLGFPPTRERRSWGRLKGREINEQLKRYTGARLEYSKTIKLLILRPKKQKFTKIFFWD